MTLEDLLPPGLWERIASNLRPPSWTVSAILEPYLQSVQTRPANSFRTLAMFSSFLRGHPSLSKAVRRLKLVAAPQENSSPTSGLYGFFDDASYIEASLFNDVVSLLPLLKELELADVLIIQCNELWCSYGGPLLSLKRLLLHYERRVQSLEDIIEHFNVLEEVHASRLPFDAPCSRCDTANAVQIRSFLCLDEGSAAIKRPSDCSRVVERAFTGASWTRTT